MPLTKAKHIGVEGAQDAEARASELDMITVVKNLVDNAIRYTPEDGRADLSVEISDGKAELLIQDKGSGIPSAERTRVLIPSAARWVASRWDPALD